MVQIQRLFALLIKRKKRIFVWKSQLLIFYLIGVIYSWTGSPLVSGPTTPLPDKKLLVFILDRLQKYVLFSFHSSFSCFHMLGPYIFFNFLY